MKLQSIIRDAIILICLILEYIVLLNVKNDLFESYFLELQLGLVYCLTLFFVLKKVHWYHLLPLFLFIFGLFNFMKIFFNIFEEAKLTDVNTIVSTNFKKITYHKMLLVYSVFIIVISLVSDFFLESEKKKTIGFFEKYFVIGKYSMFITFPLVIYRGVIEISFLSGQSFTELYVGGSSSVPIPSYVRIGTIIFQVGYMFILGSMPSKKVFYKYSFLYLLSIIPNLFIGLRNTFGLNLLAMVWFYLNCYTHKIRLIKILVPGIILILFLQWIAIFREGSTLDASVFSLLPLFLSYQSTSMYVLALYIENQQQVLSSNYPYVLDPLVSWYLGADGQTMETIQQRSSLGHDLVYFLNPEIYLSGMSFGTSCIAELYEFGILGVIFGALIMSIAIIYFQNKFQENRILLLASLFVSTYFLIAPRSNFLPNFYFLFRYVIIGFLLTKVYSLFLRKNVE